MDRTDREVKFPVVGTLLEVHRDVRRAIAEYNAMDMSFSVQRFSITGHEPLGNHYHRQKSETFVITSGFGVVILASMRENGEVLGGPKRHRIAPGSVIHVPAMTAHVFVFTTDSAEMFCWSSAGFDRAAPDIHPYVLVPNVLA